MKRKENSIALALCFKERKKEVVPVKATHRYWKWMTMLMLVMVLSVTAAFAASTPCDGVVAGQTVTMSKDDSWPDHVSVVYEGMSYHKDNDEDYYTLYSYTAPGGTPPDTLVLADSIDGYPVKLMDSVIDNQHHYEKIHHLVLGKNIEEIYSTCMPYGNRLEEITIPQGSKLRWICSNAFSNCKYLRRIGVGSTDKLPASLTRIDSYSLYGCALRTLDLSETNVARIPECMLSKNVKLTKLSLPRGLQSIDSAAFSDCLGLKSITIPKNVTYLGYQAFGDCTALSSITLECGLPGPNEDNEGFAARVFQGIDPQATIYIPRPATAQIYQDSLYRIYSRGWAAASVKVRLIENKGSYMRAPTNVRVDLTGLEGKPGVTVDTGTAASDIGCAAIVTVTGNGTGATMKALASGGDNVYWSYAQAYTGEMGTEPITGRAYTGLELTERMYAGARRTGENKPTADLGRATGYKRFGSYFYFPVATNVGSRTSPETSTVGKPVLVRYLPSETYLPDIKMDSTGKSMYVRTAWGEEKQTGYGPKVVVRGFEALFDPLPQKGDPAQTGGWSLTYQWYNSPDSNPSPSTDEKLAGESGTLEYYGYVRGGTTDDILWNVPLPSDSVRKDLPPGIHTLYAVVTLRTPEGKTFSVNTGTYEFNRYDETLLRKCIVLELEGEVQKDTANPGQYKAARNADVYASVKLDYSQIPADQQAGYKQLADRIVGSTFVQYFKKDGQTVKPNLAQSTTAWSAKLDTGRLLGSGSGGDSDSFKVSGQISYFFDGDRQTHTETITQTKVVTGTGTDAVELPGLDFMAAPDDPRWKEVNYVGSGSPQAIRLYVEPGMEGMVEACLNKQGQLYLYAVDSPDEVAGGRKVSGRLQYSQFSKYDSFKELRYIYSSMRTGANYFYFRYRDNQGRVDYRSPMIVAYKPAGNNDSYSAQLSQMTPNVTYLSPNGQSEATLRVQLTDEYLTAPTLEYTTTPYQENTWKAVSGSYHELDVQRESRVEDGLMITNEAYTVTLNRTDGSGDFFDAFAGGKDTVYLRLKLQPNYNNRPVLYSNRLEVVRSEVPVSLELTAARGGKTVTDREILVQKGDKEPLTLTAVCSGSSDLAIRWRLDYLSGSSEVLKADYPDANYSYVTTTYSGNTSVLTVPVPTNDYATTGFTVTAICENAEGTVGAAAPSRQVRVNRLENALEPYASSLSGMLNYRLQLGAAEDLPLITASAYSRDGGTLTWQWYRCLDSQRRGATPIPKASGVGEDASWALTPEDTAQEQSFWYFCEFTNFNPSAEQKKTAVYRAPARQITVETGLVAVSKPEIDGFDSYVFNYTESYAYPTEPFTIRVKKPAPLENVMDGEGPFTANQGHVELEAESLNLDSGYVNTYYFRDSDITRTEDGGYYVYSIAPKHLLGNCCAIGSDMVFKLNWTVRNWIVGKPSNLATGKDSIGVTTDTVTINRAGLPAPGLEKDSDGNAVGFHPGAVRGTTTFTDENGETSTVRYFEQYEGVVDPEHKDGQYGYRPITVQYTPNSCPDQDTVTYSGGIYVWDAVEKKWTQSGSMDDDGTCWIATPDRMQEQEFTFWKVEYNARRNGPAGQAVSNHAASEIFAARQIKNPTSHAKDPVFEGEWTDARVWDTDDTASGKNILVGTSGWKSPDSGKLTFRWEWWNGSDWLPISLTDPGVSTTNGGETLRLNRDSAPVQYALEQYEKDPSQSVNLKLRLTVTNINNAVDGVWKRTVRNRRMNLTFGTVADTPNAVLNADKTQWNAAQADRATLTVAVDNVADKKKLSYFWEYRVDEVDGKAVSGQWIYYSNNAAAEHTVADWSFSYRVKTDPVEDIDLYYDSFWKEHDSIKLSWRCTVTHTDNTSTAVTSAEKITAPVAVTIHRPVAPGFVLDSKFGALIYDPNVKTFKKALGIELGGMDAVGFEQGEGYNIAYRRPVSVTAKMDGMGNWTEEDLVICWQEFTDGKWVTQETDTGSFKAEFAAVAQLGRTRVFRAMVYGAGNMGRSRETCSEVFWIRGVKPVNAAEPSYPAAPEAPRWHIGKTESIALGADWSVTDGGTLSYRWEYQAEDGRDYPVEPTAPVVTLDPKTGGLTLTADFPPVAAAIKKGKTEKNVKLILKQYATNEKLDVTGEQRSQSIYVYRVPFGVDAEAPVLKLTTTGKTDFLNAQETTPTVKVAMTNLKSGWTVKSQCMYQILAVDGKSVTAQPQSQGIDPDLSKTYPVGDYGNYFRVDDSTFYTLDAANFWRAHESLKVKVWFSVRITDETATGLPTAEAESESVEITVRAPKTPDLVEDKEHHTVTFDPYVTEITAKLPAALGGGTVRGYEKSTGYGSDRAVSASARLEGAGSWTTEKNLWGSLEYWDAGKEKWYTWSSFGLAEQGRLEKWPTVDNVGETKFYRFAFRGQESNEYGTPRTREVYSEIFALKGVKAVDAQLPGWNSDVKTDAQWVVDKTASVTLGQNAWSVTDGGALSYSWEYYDDAKGDYVPIEAGPGVTLDKTGGLTLDSSCPLVAELLNKAKSEKTSVTLGLRQIAANTNNKVSGSRTTAKSMAYSMDFGTVAETPAVTVSSNQTYSDFYCGQQTAPTFTVTVSNEAACGSLSYNWYYTVLEVDGVAVKAGERNLGALGASWQAGTYGQQFYAEYGGTDHDLQLNNSYAWKEHESLKLQVKCVVANSDSSVTLDRYATAEPVTAEITVRKPQAPDAALTAQVTGFEAMAAPDSIQIPTGGSVRLSVPEKPNQTYQWYQSTGGSGYPLEGKKASAITVTPDMLSAGPYFYCEISSRDIDNESVEIASATSKKVLLGVIDLNQAAQPYVTEWKEQAYGDPDGSVTLSAKATSPDGGVLSYQWYRKDGGGWTKLTGEESKDLTVTAPAAVGGQQTYKLVITNTNIKCKNQTATVEKVATLTARGLKVLLPETIPNAVAGAPYELEFTVRSFGENKPEGLTVTAPEGYTAAKVSGSTWAMSGTGKAVTGGKLAAKATIDGKTCTAESEPFTVKLQALGMKYKKPESLPTFGTAGPQPAGKLTVIGGSGGTTQFAKLSGPDWVTVNAETGELTVELPADRAVFPGWYKTVVKVTVGADEAQLPVSVGVKAPGDKTAWLYETGNKENILRMDGSAKSGEGWTWDGETGLLTLENFTGHRLENTYFIKLIGDNKLSHTGGDYWYATIFDNGLMLTSDEAASLTVTSKRNKGSSCAFHGRGIYLDDKVTLNLSAESTGTSNAYAMYSDAADHTVTVRGNGVLNASATSAYSARGVYESLSVYDGADVNLTVTGSGKNTKAVMKNLETYGTGDITIVGRGSYTANTVGPGEHTIAHTGGTLTIRYEGTGTERYSVLGGNVTQEGDYEIIGHPGGNSVSYRALGDEKPVWHQDLPQEFGQPLGFPIEADYAVFSKSEVTWSATGLPKGVTLVPDPADSRKAGLTGTTAEVGEFNATLTATNEFGSASLPLTLTVAESMMVVDSAIGNCGFDEKDVLRVPGQASGSVIIIAGGKLPEKLEAVVSSGNLTVESAKHLPSSPDFDYNDSLLKFFDVKIKADGCTVGETGTLTLKGLDAGNKELSVLEVPYKIMPETAARSITVNGTRYSDTLYRDINRMDGGSGWKWDAEAGKLILVNGQLNGKIGSVYGPTLIEYSGEAVMGGDCTVTAGEGCDVILAAAGPGAILDVYGGFAKEFFENNGKGIFRGGKVGLTDRKLSSITGLELQDVELLMTYCEDPGTKVPAITINNTDKEQLYAQAGSLKTGYAYTSTVLQPIADIKNLKFPPKSITEGETLEINVPVLPYVTSDDKTIEPTYQWYYLVEGKRENIDGETGSGIRISGLTPGSYRIGQDATFESYKTLTGKTENASFDITVEPQGHTVRGSVSSYNPKNDITVEMQNQDGVSDAITSVTPGDPSAAAGSASQDIVIETVPDGTYDATVSKPGHLDTTITDIPVSGGDVDLGKVTLIPGDVNGDGFVNTDDLGILIKTENYDKAAADVDNKLCDLNGDGFVNTDDLAILIKTENYDKGTSDTTVQYQPPATPKVKAMTAPEPVPETLTEPEPAAETVAEAAETAAEPTAEA